MVEQHPALFHEFLHMPIAQRVRHIPPYAHQNDILREMGPFEAHRHRLSPFHGTLDDRGRSYLKSPSIRIATEPTEEASAAAFTQSYQAFQHAAAQQEPSYRVRGVLTDGFDSTTKSLRTLFPGAQLGFCLRHALLQLPKKLAAIASPVRQSLRAQFHTLLYRARQRKGLRVFALGQRLCHFADHVTHMAGTTNGARVRRWFQDKKAGWYAVLADSRMPVTSTLLDQAHNAIARKLFAMKGFHHPGGSQQAFLTGLAHLYNLVPYQRRAKHAGQCRVEVEGGKVPTRDWFLNLQILTSGGFR
jgi:hypothetical protein